MSTPQEVVDQFGQKGLLLQDKINHNYLLANQILTIQKLRQSTENVEFQIKKAIQGLVALIPQVWKDPDFDEDMKKAEITRNIDTRPSFCGMPANFKVCQDLGISSIVTIMDLNQEAALQACMNLLERRGMLTKKIIIEEFTGFDESDLKALEAEELKKI